MAWNTGKKKEEEDKKSTLSSKGDSIANTAAKIIQNRIAQSTALGTTTAKATVTPKTTTTPKATVTTTAAKSTGTTGKSTGTTTSAAKNLATVTTRSTAARAGDPLQAKADNIIANRTAASDKLAEARNKVADQLLGNAAKSNSTQQGNIIAGIGNWVNTNITPAVNNALSKVPGSGLIDTLVGNVQKHRDERIEAEQAQKKRQELMNTLQPLTNALTGRTGIQRLKDTTVQDNIRNGVGPYASEDEIEQRFQDSQAKRLALMTNVPGVEDVGAYSGWYNDTVEEGLRNQSENVSDWATWKLKARKNELEAKDEEYKNTRTAENLKSWNDEKSNLQRENGALYDLQQYGLEITANPYFEVQNQTVKGRPEDYGEDGGRDLYYDEILYDAVHGEGAFKRIWDKGDDLQDEKTVEEIEELWDSLENGTLEELNETSGRNARITELNNLINGKPINQQELDKINQELANRAAINQYVEGAGKIDDSQLGNFTAPEYRQMDWAMGTPNAGLVRIQDKSMPYTVNGDEADEAYVYIKHPQAGWQDNINDSSQLVYFMPDEWKDVFLKYYESGDKASAQAFYDAVRPTLESRRSEYRSERDIENAKGAYGLLYSAADVLMKPVEGILGTVSAVGTVLGNKYMANPNSDINRLSQYSANTRGARAEVWGDAAKDAVINTGKWLEGAGKDLKDSGKLAIVADLMDKGGKILQSEGVTGFVSDAAKVANGIGYSLADNVYAMAITAGLGSAFDFTKASKVAEVAMQTIMSTEATAGSFYDNIVSGREPVEAAILAIGDGFVEAGTEKIKWGHWIKMDEDAMLKGAKAVWNWWNISGVTEGGEEIIGNIGNAVLDKFVSAAFGHKSELENKVRKLQETEHISTDEAWGRVMKDFMKDTALAGLSGYVSGMVLGAGNIVAQNVGIKSAGKTIRTAEEVRGKSGTEQLVDAALGMNKDTLSYKIASELKGAQENGVPVSDYQIGRLAMNVYNETSQSIGNVARDIVLDQAKASIQALGVKDADAPAAAIAKAVVEGMDSLSKSERAEITGSDAAMTVMQGFMQDRGQQLAAEVRVAQETAKARSIRETVNQLTSGKAIASAASGAVRDSYRKAEIADPAAIMAASGKRSVGVMDALQTGEDGTDRAVTITAINKDGTIQVKTENGTENVDAGDVVAGSAEVAALLRFARTNTGLITNSITNADGKSATDYSYVNAVLQEIAKNGGKQQAQAASFLDDAIKIRMRAFSEGAMPKTNISTEAAQALWTAAKSDFDAMEAQRTAVRTAIKENAGTMTFMGGEYGSKRFEEQIKRHLTKSQQNEARVLGEISKRMGFQVELINDTDNTDIFGWEDRGTGKITINMAGDDGNGNRHSIITTAAHEMTHWIEQNSKEGYAALREYVFDGLRKQGVDVDNLIMNKMESYAAAGQDVDMGGAIAEIVADSCGEVLGSETMAAELKKVNPNLYSRVKEFVRTFVDRAKEAINAMRGSSSYEARQLRSQVEELSRIWLGAKAEGMGAGATGTAVDTAGRQMSVRESQQNQQTQQETDKSNDVRYSLANKRTRDYLSMWGRHRVSEYQDMQAKILNKYGLKASDITNGNVMAEDRWSALGISKKDQAQLQNIAREMDRWENYRVDAMGLDESDLGAQYVEAWYNGDRERMDQILMEKMTGTDGVIPYKAPHWYSGAMHQWVSNAIKEGNEYAIKVAATEMANLVPKNAVLVPMPPHTGVVTDTTDTMLLAKQISELTGRPVLTALEGVERQSRKESKEGAKSRQITAEDMGFRQVADIPEGMIPIFIDNVVGSGVTAQAAHNALGQGVTLAYAKSSRAAIDGLKNAAPTYYDPQQTYLIPLEDRFDMNQKGVKGTKYAVRDQAYQQAVESGDTTLQQMMVDEAAKEAFSNSKVLDKDGNLLKVYHGTGSDFNEFKREYIGSTGRFEGSGFNFTPYEGRASSYGKNVLAGYLNIQKPLSAERKTISVAKLAQIIREADPTGDNIISDYARETRDYGKDSFVRREAITAARSIWDASDNDVDIYSFISAADSDAEGLISKFEELGYDGLIHYDDEGKIKTAVAFSSNQFKRADPVTYDDNGKPIDLSERFNTKEPDIRYSVKQGEKPVNLENDRGEDTATLLPGNTVASTQYSVASYYDLNEREKMTKELKKAGYTQNEIEHWISQLDSIAAIVLSDRTRYDFDADRMQKFLKDNGDVYKKTLDASTMCKKTRLYNGTFNLVQHMLPHTILMPEDLIELYNIMKDRNLETPCGICYVQSRRRQLGPYTKEWLSKYKGPYIPSIDEVTTSDGLEKLRVEHPKAYTDFVKAMNKKGVNNPKLVQQRTDYRGDIRRLKKDTIKYLNDIGGLRIQSFSDFEVVHMLDMMQAVMDMKAVGLSAQAYTKVPEFAMVFGPTGIKINLSLIGKGVGVDHHGNLVLDDDEGMPFDKAMELRGMYPENVGTIIVGINDDHIITAMGDDRIDFIIPFHKSGWSKAELDKIRTLRGYEDYTDSQNEYLITTDEEGNEIRVKAESNIDPLSYWNFDKNGQENADIYLKECAKKHLVPKFAQFLVDNGDGTYSLPTDDSQRSQNIRKGYWKTLIDFKMYDNNGVGAPQQKVQPTFNMEAAREILSKYDGSHRTLPEDEAAAKEYVEWYKKTHPLDNVRRQYAVRNAMDMDVATWMESLSESQMQTEAEKKLLQDYKALRMKQSLNIKRQSDTQNKISQLENYAKERELTQEEKRMLSALKIKLQNAKDAGADIAEQLYQVTSSEGYAGLMYQQSKVMDDYITGKTQGELNEAVDDMTRRADEIQARLQKQAEELGRIAESAGVQRVRSYLGASSLREMAGVVKKAFGSTISNKELEAALAEIALKRRAGEPYMEDVQNLAGRVMETVKDERDSDLARLRGMTITISEEQLQEMIGQRYNMKEKLRGLDDKQRASMEKKIRNEVMKELRGYLAGTGIKIAVGERSTLVDDMSNFREEFGAGIINEDAGELDVLDEFLKWVQKRKEQSKGSAQYQLDPAEVIGVIIGAANNVIYKEGDTKADRDALAEAVTAMQGEVGNAIKAINSMMKSLDELRKSGHQAQAWTAALQRDAYLAIGYYNKIARMAQETAREKKLRDTIAQLKSEAAQKLAKNNEEWRELIARDKQARETAEDIGSARREIHTAVSRLYKLLSEPKGLKNIPEHLQGLARELIRIVVDNDLSEMRHKISNVSKKQLKEVRRRLTAWEGQSGPFSLGDLNEDENAPMAIINSDLDEIYRAVEEWNGEIRGKNKADTLAKRHEIIHRMQEAVTEIYSYIRSGQDININRKRIAVEDAADAVREGTGGKKFREWTGKAGRVISGLHKAIVSGNMTPEYFFRNLGNKGLNTLWEGYHEAENRNGLELAKARDRLAEIAEKYGYKNWDMNQKIRLQLDSGDVTVTLGQLMSLYATWRRENTLGPEMSQHLYNGGFYAEQDTKDGLLGRAVMEKKAHRLAKDEESGYDEGVKFGELLTDEQKAFVDDVVGFLSDDMSKLGNEASMKAYGIKMYKEKYYFPFQIWDGVKARKSNEGAAAAGANDRAFHPSFSKSRMHGAGNALVIGDFLQTAADHVAGMINYATMGLANENLQKVLNYSFEEGEPGNTTKRNVRAMLEEAYGREAMQYLETLKTQLNGGAVKVEKSMYDRLLSMFRKNAVAGSLSVAAQQPLSYIRAAMMISPKYLARALSPDMWKGSYQEMLQHSGVAVIKEMGRFDMNAGQTAREYLMPDAKQTGIQKAWNQITDKMTILPEKMDAMTWTRMWSAVKAEQKALHPEMDVKSDEFLDMCGERFNDIMRRTQVYDSTLVRSENMRSQNQFKKSITSFMAEPTLTLNVLADAVRMAKNGEKGGAAMVAKAGATFIVSAILQAAVKAAFRTGRSPDEKKTWAEQYINALTANMISEMDPMQLIPGYSDLVELLKEGKLQDDAMGIIGKFFTAKDSVTNLLLGDSKDPWRDVEDSVGQIVQLFTNLPAKNLSREVRAIINWATGTKYAQRDTSAAVLKYQALDTVHSADNLLGVINNWLGAAGYETGNKAYYQRIYDARKAGDQAKANEMTEYLVSGRGVKPETINTQMNTLTKADENLSGAEKVKALMDNGYKSPAAYVKDLYSKGELTRTEAEKLYAEASPKAKDKDIHDALDEIDYEQATGREIDNYTNYTPLYDAMDAGDDKAIQKRKAELVDMGYKEKDILSSMKSYIKKQYKEGELTRAEAEAQLKKCDPSIQAKDMAKMLDEIDYEEETGKDVSYSNYTPLFDAINAGKTTDVKSARAKLKTLGYKDSDIDTEIGGYIRKQYQNGEITRAQAESRLAQYSGLSKDDAWWALDRVDYQKKTGKNPGSGKYYRLYDAIEANRSADISAAVGNMLKYGLKKENIKKQLTTKYKDAYLEADSAGKVKLKNALELAYKALGYTTSEADKTINSWGKTKKKGK